MLTKSTLTKWLLVVVGSVAEIEAIGTQTPHLYTVSVIMMILAGVAFVLSMKLPPRKSYFAYVLSFVIIGSCILGFMLLESREVKELVTYGVGSFGIVTFVATDDQEIRQHGHYIEIVYEVAGVQYFKRVAWQGVHVGDTVIVEYSRRYPDIYKVIR